MGSSWLAVVMNSTLRQVERQVEVVVAERVVLLGVEHLEQALEGSPRQSAPILSISSIMNSGLSVPASRMARRMMPGMAPT